MMTSMPWCAAACGLMLSLVGSSAAEAAINLNLNYTVTAGGARGTRTIPDHLRFAIKKKQVLVYQGGRLIASRSSGRGNLYGPALFRVGYHGNAVDFSAIYSSHVTRAHVTTDGRSTCHAGITVQLKPGHRTYMFGPMPVYHLRVYRISCRLSTT